MSEYYIGVMSGTSLDGIDISLCEIDKDRCTQIYYMEYPYNQGIKKDILHAIAHPIALEEFGVLDTKLGQMYLDALKKFIVEFKVDAENIKAIGLHGQTLWHQPDTSFAFSLQLGNVSLVAKGLGIDTVSDFRSADIANGGQGAPLTPAFHQFLFASQKSKKAVLNLGGIANLTILNEKLLGYDVAPANMLLDIWIQKNKNQEYDAQGSWARSGNVDRDLLKVFLADPFFKQSAPKSTGRELFNASWLERKLDGFILATQDVQATLLELSVVVISKEIKKYNVEELLVSGGGAKNSYFLKRLSQELSNVEVHPTDAVGVRGDSLEAMAFAWLAKKCIHKELVHLKDVTGAKKDSILGAVYAGN